MKINKNYKGFTLVELLVVVAIVGLLASFIVVNMKNPQKRAHDQNIKKFLHQVRNVAEMNYQQEKYNAVCNEENHTLSDQGQFGTLEVSIMKENNNQPVSCYESDNKEEFAVSSPLVSKPDKHWCVEEAGHGIEIDEPVSSATCQ